MISLQELEHAAAVMMAAPSLVTQDQRHTAEQVFLNFRRSKMPYVVCKEILEQGKNDYVLFQAASTIKGAIVHEWAILNKEDIESLRTFLLTFVTHRHGIQKYVKEQVLQVVAIICKRGMLDNPHIVKESLLRDVMQLTSGSNREMQILGCSILKALLNEFSFLNRSSNIGLSWELHTRCKKVFEAQALKQVFMIAVQALQQFLEIEVNSFSRQDIGAVASFLSLAEQVLSWDFCHYYQGLKYTQSSEMLAVTLFKPDVSWRGLVSDPTFLGLFFNLQIKFQANDELYHHSCQCLVQLASLLGPVFADAQSQTQYLANFVQGYLQLSKSLEMTGQTALGLGSIINRLLFVFPSSAFKALHTQTLKLFVNAMTDLTCSFLQSVAKEEELHSEDTSYIEAVEHFMEGWSTLLEHSSHFVPGLFSDGAARIFNCYVQCHLSAPDGLRGTFSAQENDTSIHLDEICDLDSDDRELFSDQLCTVGNLGRIVLDHALALLSKLLDNRVAQFEKQLCTVKNSAGSVHAGFSSLDNLYEDLHWLILISGYLLADESEGETPLIPKEIITYSSSMQDQVDIATSFELLRGSRNHMLGTPERTSRHSQVDPVVKLISTIFRLAELEKQALSSGLFELLSPQVGRTVVWCLRHWAKSYLLPDEKEYEQLSISLISLFGMGTDGGKWTLGFLLDKVRSNLSGWSAEFQIVEDTSLLLLSLVDTKNRATLAISFDDLWLLAQEHMSKTAILHEMPPEVLRCLTQALVLAGSAAADTDRRDKYLNQLLQSLQSHFMSICHQPDFAKCSQKEPTRTQVQCLLESFRGVALASNHTNSRTLFTYLLPVMRDSVALLNVYQNCPDVVVLVLEFYVDLVDSQLALQGESGTTKLYQSCMALVQAYGKCNLGKLSDDALMEEEHLNDLVLLTKLLNNLLSKEFLDFGEEKQMSAADVALYGLHVIIPLMSPEVLKFPVLCTEFFKLTTYVCEMYPDKMSLLPEALFKNLMASLEVGLTNYGPDITKMSLEALSSLASHCFVEIQKNTTAPLHEILQHFLKTLFDMLLLQSFDMDLLQPAAEAFLALICCHQMYYTELVRSLLAQQTDRIVCQRLLEAFNQLTPSDMTLSLDRLNKVQFRKSLDAFLGSVKGFLCVK